MLNCLYSLNNLAETEAFEETESPEGSARCKRTIASWREG